MGGLLQVSESQTDQQKICADSPLTSLVRWSLLRALESRASDIHYEPDEDIYRIRLRIDGFLIVVGEYPIELRESITYELKRQFNLPITDVESPADSSAYFPDWKLQVRSNKSKTDEGEKVVVRLFRLGQQFDIQDSGYIPMIQTYLSDSILRKSGVVILSGGTGSGKTTTLYSLVSKLNEVHRNISTLEDPVECRFPGVNQFRVSKYQSFSDGLRALLRQDPDVILVGEIRDEKTAELCFHAANTGHLVLTTIHANTAWGVFNRLVLLGLDPAYFSESINLIVTQELFPRLCQSCSLPLRADTPLTSLTSILPTVSTPKKPGPGCSRCRDGFYGQIPVPEVLIPSLETNFSDKEKCTFVSKDESLLELSKCGVIDGREVSSA